MTSRQPSWPGRGFPAAIRDNFSQGPAAVGLGLVVLGLTAYGFLVVAARALGPDRYASLSALWALVFLVGPGVFNPVEQELTRAISSRRELGAGYGPLLATTTVVGSVALALLLALTLVTGPLLLRELFDDDILLVVGLDLAVAGFLVQHLARGVLAGKGQLGPYGAILGLEGIVRLVACGVLATAGVRSAGPYGIAVGIAPFLSALPALTGGRRPSPGPPVGRREVSAALGWLLVGSLSAQLLINAAPLVVKVLASPGDEEAAGRFLAGAVLARIPLFLFQAVQSTLLPHLSAHHAARRGGAFGAGVRRLVGVVVTMALAATALAVAFGPSALRLFFGPEFVLTRVDVGYLAAASGAYMVAVALSQALIALSRHPRVAAGWLVGVVAFAAVTVLGTGVVRRAEMAFLAGSLSSAVAMGALLAPLVRNGGNLGDDGVATAVGEEPSEQPDER